MPLLTQLAIGTLAVVWLIIPGWLIARRCGLPYPLLAGFVSGAIGLNALIFALQITSTALSRTAITAAWLLVTLTAIILCRKTTGPALRTPPLESDGSHRRLLPWLILVPVLAVTIWRVTFHPLFGMDTSFRWNYLAELMLTHRTLDFYPPTTGADYALYAWPDGIPPLVSSLYFWSYSLAGSALGALTAPVVLTQFGLLLLAVQALARREFSPQAGIFAAVLLAVTPMAVWATTMGQETGLTALSLVAMLLYLPRNPAEENTPAMVMAALAAALGALAREYGWAFLVVGVVLGRSRGLSWRRLALFSAVVFLAAAPWYARNAILTGNPLFNLDVGGLLPVNRPHAALMELYRQNFRLGEELANGLDTLAFTCFAALAGGLAGALLFRKKAGGLLLAAATVGALWMASVAYTAAGFTYTLRVLNPLLALGAVLGGGACAHWFKERPRLMLCASIGLFFFSIDAALRTLVLPSEPYVHRPSDWTRIDDVMQTFQHRPIYDEIARRTNGGRVLVLGPHIELIRLGVAVVPTWSPEVAFLFDGRESAGSAAQHLSRLGIHHVVVSKGWINSRYLLRSLFFQEAPLFLHPSIDAGDMALYDIRIPQKQPSP
jgi:hypothetical protein